MGYYKNQEILQQVEIPDRIMPEPTGRLFESVGEESLAPRKIKHNRRLTYRAQNYWVVKNSDMAIIFAFIPLTLILGILLGILYKVWGG